jgi:DNA-binding SARP family transcriptional activator
MAMRFAVLGPVRVAAADGEWRAVRGRMQRTVLAELLLNANSVVRNDRLAELLWPERIPDAATASLHNHMMRLRQFLDAPDQSLIRAVPHGYLLRLDAEDLDLLAFRRLCSEAGSAARQGQWETAALKFADALALWQGEPVEDVPAIGSTDVRVQRLLEARTGALEGRIDADLRLGRHRDLSPGHCCGTDPPGARSISPSCCATSAGASAPSRTANATWPQCSTSLTPA